MILFLIIFAASTIGAVSGVGGGVIIKPVLDAVTDMDVSFIGFLSTCAVFSMSVSAAAKHLYRKAPFQKATILLGIGAVAGGLLGTGAFEWSVSYIASDNRMKIFQNMILFFLLLCIMIYMGRKEKRQFCIHNQILTVMTGIMLGFLSSYLGIGGGPFNVAVLTIFFAMDIRQASVNSIVLILFSQTSKIVTLIATDAVPHNVKAPLLLWVFFAAVSGGAIGSTINRKVDRTQIRLVYNCVMIFILIMCLWNISSTIREV